MAFLAQRPLWQGGILMSLFSEEIRNRMKANMLSGAPQTQPCPPMNQTERQQEEEKPVSRWKKFKNRARSFMRELKGITKFLLAVGDFLAAFNLICGRVSSFKDGYRNAFSRS